METSMSAIPLVQQTKRQYEPMLMKLNNVVAIGIGFKIAGEVQPIDVHQSWLRASPA